jgi:hypothetical protein
MKFSITLIFILLSFKLFAQRLNGIVIDQLTNLPIQNVSIKITSPATFSSFTGKFGLSNVHIGDTIKFSCIGYKSYNLVLNKINGDTIRVYLEQNFILLKNVTINGINGYKADSIDKRKEFASAFNYRSPGLKDIFITKSPYAYVPNSYNIALNSTTSIVSINLLSAFSLLNKNKAPVSRLQKVLLKDEEDSYIDHVFSKVRVSKVTSLKGDSLSEFMNIYRPPIKELKKMTDYDLTFYIKKSYQEFIKTYKHEDHSPFIK